MTPADTLRRNLSVVSPKKSFATSSAEIIGRPAYIAISMNAVFTIPRCPFVANQSEIRA